GPRHLRLASHHEDTPALVLARVVVGLGKRQSTQQGGGDHDGAWSATTHFAPAGASGRDVTGAPASSSGATKLYASRMSRPPGEALRSSVYDVTPQLATSPLRSIERISSSVN